jgi:Zn finger protein HypA/HybF involved in hydrogenase expression
MAKLTIHCDNCTDNRKGTELPKEYQTGAMIVSTRGVTLCPRCKSPSVMVEDKQYTKALFEGFDPFYKPKTKRKM